MKKILIIIGTRPEAVKMAPVVRALLREPWLDVRVVATAQHRDMLDQVLQFFEIIPEIDLNLMAHDQTLASLSAKLLARLDTVLHDEQPDAVLVQGDTTTVLMASLACFYRKIPVGHIEAGLRTGNINSPFPEEANRTLVAKLARWHFAPTLECRHHLMREGVDGGAVYVTGNTVIDALLEARTRVTANNVSSHEQKAKTILVTIHRRENFGAPLVNICQALSRIVSLNPDIRVLFPVHPNPRVNTTVFNLLGANDRIVLCNPLSYGEFVSAMVQSFIILTDSGGVQEEAPALGKPVFVLREETERPEAVAAGAARLVGSDQEIIVREVQRVLSDGDAYAAMQINGSPYGDGSAAERIVSVLRGHFA